MSKELTRLIFTLCTAVVIFSVFMAIYMVMCLAFNWRVSYYVICILPAFTNQINNYIVKKFKENGHI